MKKPIIVLLILSAVFITACGRDPIPFRRGEKWGFCNEKKEIVIPPQYDYARPFHEDLALVVINTPDPRCGFVERSGREVIPPQYEETDGFTAGLAAVKKNGRWGYIDKTGRVVIPLEYDQKGRLAEGMVVSAAAG